MTQTLVIVCDTRSNTPSTSFHETSLSVEAAFEKYELSPRYTVRVYKNTTVQEYFENIANGVANEKEQKKAF